jgi:putative ABC transport system permease protein
MTAGFQFAWLQLTKRTSHLVAATAGVTFSVTLLLVQIGMRDALLESSVGLYRSFKADLVIASWQYQCYAKPAFVAERRLAQARAVPGVLSATPVQLSWGSLKNPVNSMVRQVLLVGVVPEAQEVVFEGQTSALRALHEPDSFLFDERSRDAFGPIGELYRKGKLGEVEVWGRNGRIVGLFQLGPGFGSDGHLVASDQTFRKFTAGLGSPEPSLGLVRLDPKVDREEALRALRQVRNFWIWSGRSGGTRRRSGLRLRWGCFWE